MGIYQVTDCTIADLSTEKYDVVVLASGYEARCTFVPKLIEGIELVTPVVLGFEDIVETEPRSAHDQYFRNRWTEPKIASAGSDFVIQELLNRAASEHGEVRRILVDCSSMSRLWYSGILNWARYGNSAEETVIAFVYAPGIYEDDDQWSLKIWFRYQVAKEACFNRRILWQFLGSGLMDGHPYAFWSA